MLNDNYAYNNLFFLLTDILRKQIQYSWPYVIFKQRQKNEKKLEKRLCPIELIVLSNQSIRIKVLFRSISL